MLHDTHAHLEMLLAKLNLLDGKWEYGENSSLTKLSIETKKKLEELISGHEFLLHSTVSTNNFEYVTQLFQDFDKIKYFLGSHPEIVNEDFDLNKYLAKQKAFLRLNPEILEGYFLPSTVILNSFQDPLTKNDSQSNTVILNLFQDPPAINESKEPKTKLKIVGIGEVGLDYHYTQDPKLIQTQKELFQSQIELAIEYNLPLMIHCRDAFDDLFEILNKYPRIHNRFLIHCFTGGTDEMYKAVKIRGKVAFGGVITFRSAKNVQEAVEYCPLENFVIETDLPFLSPKRGEVCLPEHIDLVAQKVAELKKIPKHEVWEWSRKNCSELFYV